MIVIEVFEINSRRGAVSKVWVEPHIGAVSKAWVKPLRGAVSLGRGVTPATGSEVYRVP